MKVDKECPCCGAQYSIRFEQIIADLDPEIDNETIYDDDSEQEMYPEFCPFCGVHESEEDLEDED